MNNSFIKCPEEEKLIEYFANMLDDFTRIQMEEHFDTCEHCSTVGRHLSIAASKQRISKATPVLGAAWSRFGDAIEAKAAGEEHSSSIREFVTKNGKFKITLRPLEKNPKLALMEIEVFDPAMKGRLQVSGVNYFNEVVEVDENRFACTVVNNSVDLDRIMIVKA